MIYLVPGSKMKKDLEDKTYMVATDEGEAVALAVGDYLATGNVPEIWVGENGLLNALDALITLVKLYDIPYNLVIYLRDDEPQHAMVTKHIHKLCDLYGIKATFK